MKPQNMNTVNALEPMLVLETSEPARQSVPAARPKTRKPRVWPAFATLFVAAIVGNLAVIATFVAVCFGTGIIMGAQGADGAKIHARTQEIWRQPLPALLLSLIPFQFGMAVVVLFAASRSKEPIKQRLGLVPPTGRAFGGFKRAKMAAFTLSTAFASGIIFNLFVGPPRRGNLIAAVMTDGS